MATKKAAKTEMTSIVAYKGFDMQMQCRGYQFEVGKTYEHDGSVRACESGFHSCENPLDVFGYYGPGTSLFCEVEASGEIARHTDDNKVASGSIKISAALSIPDFIARAVKWALDHVDGSLAQTLIPGTSSAATNTGDRSAATNTGYRSAATNTGDRSAATNTGDRSAATNTGDSSAATNTGDSSAATNTGYRSAATNTGDSSAATNTGYRSAATVSGANSVALAMHAESRAMACEGSAIVCVYRDSDWRLIHIRAGIAGRDVKPDTWYTLDKDGEFVEAAQS